MKTARDFPITYKFGYSKKYGGWHSGVDRGTPLGTPVVVNKTKIGETGNTGKSTGPHLHLTRQRAFVPINPRNTGFKMRTRLGRKPKVIFAGTNSKRPANGKYVVIQGWQGDQFFYCHLSKITCKVGDVIK